MRRTGLFESCRVEVRSASGAPLFECDDCDVRLEADELVVHYWDDDGAVVFSGRGHDDGHFELWCRSRPVRADLSPSRDGRTLSGSWHRDEVNGTWTIELPGDG